MSTRAIIVNADGSIHDEVELTPNVQARVMLTEGQSVHVVDDEGKEWDVDFENLGAAGPAS